MEKKVTIGLRLASMLVDHFIMTIISMLVLGIGLGLSMLTDYLWNDTWFIWVVIIFFFAMSLSIYLNKDTIKGQSPAKRILLLQVIDNKSGQIASPLKCLVRNLTFPVWIVELPFILINPKRRLGDLIANTRVEIINNSLEARISYKYLTISIILGGLYIFIILALYLIVNQKALGLIENLYYK